MSVADSARGVSAPRDREKAISAAYLRSLGLTQAMAATAAGIGERTLREWEVSVWWPEVQAEAVDRWLSGVRTAARAGLLRALEAEPSVRDCLAVLERLEPALCPQAVQVQAAPVAPGLTVVLHHEDGEREPVSGPAP